MPSSTQLYITLFLGGKFLDCILTLKKPVKNRVKKRVLADTIWYEDVFQANTWHKMASEVVCSFGFREMCRIYKKQKWET